MLNMVERRSQHNWIFQELLFGDLELCVTTEILEEYEEIAAMRFGAQRAEFMMQAIINLPKLIQVNVSYRWGLIKADVDDNKFVDCALAGQSPVIITYDKHFKELKSINFPRVYPFKVEDFKRFLEDFFLYTFIKDK
jgi:predicted nucleic acid-binding protein